jgi:tRNA nucleotidyltransferase (CCA-adding enzyme)
VALVRDLERAGFEAWCVGGAVRDALLGHAHLDWDLATSATPDQVQEIFGKRRTVPVGIEFGTVKVFDSQGTLHEVTTFRRDVRTDGRHADVEFGASLDEDLARRDFTVNAMAFSPSTGELRDPFAGQEDLARGIVRAVGDAAQRMREDYLRALRALRFAARFGFEIEAATWSAIRGSAPHLTRLSAERVKQELEKTMDQVRAPSGAMALWKDSGALGVLLPELEAAGASGEAVRATDCTGVPGLPRRPGRRLTRIAVLLSDVAPAEVLRLTTRLRFSKSDGQWIAALVERWARNGSALPDATARDGRGAERSALRRWVAGIGRVYLSAYFRVAAARWAARRESGGSAPSRQTISRSYRESLRLALTEPLDLRDLAIDGDDLRQLGVAPGPALGKILSTLLDRVIDDPAMNTRERLMDEARHLHSSETHPHGKGAGS